MRAGWRRPRRAPAVPPHIACSPIAMTAPQITSHAPACSRPRRRWGDEQPQRAGARVPPRRGWSPRSVTVGAPPSLHLRRWRPRRGRSCRRRMPRRPPVSGRPRRCWPGWAPSRATACARPPPRSSWRVVRRPAGGLQGRRGAGACRDAPAAAEHAGTPASGAGWPAGPAAELTSTAGGRACDAQWGGPRVLLAARGPGPTMTGRGLCAAPRPTRSFVPASPPRRLPADPGADSNQARRKPGGARPSSARQRATIGR